MILSKIDDLVREKEYREKRRLSLATIAKETDLAIGTVQKLRRGEVSRVYLSTLDTLCAYFGVQVIGEVLEYVPGNSAKEEGTKDE